MGVWVLIWADFLFLYMEIRTAMATTTRATTRRPTTMPTVREPVAGAGVTAGGGQVVVRVASVGMCGGWVASVDTSRCC